MNSTRFSMINRTESSSNREFIHHPGMPGMNPEDCLKSTFERAKKFIYNRVASFESGDISRDTAKS